MKPKVPPLTEPMPPFERPREWWRAHHVLVGSSKLLAIEWLAKNDALSDQEHDFLKRRAHGEKVPELGVDLAPERAALLLNWPKDDQ